MFTSQQQETVTWIAGVIATVAVVMAVARFAPLNLGSSQPTQPAPSKTNGNSKKSVLGTPAGGLLSETVVQGKGSPYLSITFADPANGPVVEGSTFEVVANIEANRDLEEYEFTWLLPKSIHALGAVSGQLAALRSGENTLLRLSAKSETSENQQIHLHVFRRINGEAVGKTAQYNTAHQMKLKADVQKKAKALKSLQASGKTLKLIQ